MGRISYYGQASDRVEPPEPDYKLEMECPNCGTDLHEGDLVYEIYDHGSPTIIACEYCINELSRFVEDL